MNSQLTQFQIVYTLVTDAVILGVIAVGLRTLSIRASGPNVLPPGLWRGLSATLLAWYGLASFLAIEGVFVASRAGVPTIPFGVLIPVIAGLVIIFRSKTAARLVDATPLHWLIAVQAYRVLGIIFLVLYAADNLPSVFAIPAGVGDMFVGIYALIVARAVRRGLPWAHRAAYSWNFAGLFDFAVALATGFLSSQSPFQLFAIDHPNRLVSAYPLVMIPVFLVPLSILFHALCLWKLRRGESVAAGAL
jgi:hypothetical protein